MLDQAVNVLKQCSYMGKPLQECETYHTMKVKAYNCMMQGCRYRHGEKCLIRSVPLQNKTQQLTYDTGKQKVLGCKE